MNKDEAFGLFICLVGAAALFVCGYGLGAAAGEVRMKDAAVEAGTAEYFLDADHNKQWRWKPTPEAAQAE